MYIHPVIVGVLGTLFVETVLFIIYGLFLSKKKPNE
jgi:hypothetical protein